MLQRREEIGRKKRREVDRERNLWEENRPEGVIVRVLEEREKNKEKRRTERVYCEKG